MPEHKGSTDETKQIKLSSSIENVIWAPGMAAPGATVTLEVFTNNVGNGAKLEIELSDHSGKKHGTFKEGISGNRFWASLRIPEKARDALYAEIKLSKHGLKQKSPALVLIPPIEISNLKWSANQANRGDLLQLTADVKGADDGTEGEISIWEYDDDGAHGLVSAFPVHVQGEKISTEWEFAYVEDTEDIPTSDETDNNYQQPQFLFTVAVSGITATSGQLVFKDWIEVELRDAEQKPHAKTKIIIRLPDGTERRETLDEDGYVRLDDIPPGPLGIDVDDVPGVEDA